MNGCTSCSPSSRLRASSVGPARQDRPTDGWRRRRRAGRRRGPGHRHFLRGAWLPPAGERGRRPPRRRGACGNAPSVSWAGSAGTKSAGCASRAATWWPPWCASVWNCQRMRLTRLRVYRDAGGHRQRGAATDPLRPAEPAVDSRPRHPARPATGGITRATQAQALTAARPSACRCA